MNITEIKERKKDLQTAICGLVHEFETETKCAVDTISVYRKDITHMDGTMIDNKLCIEVLVKL